MMPFCCDRKLHGHIIFNRIKESALLAFGIEDGFGWAVSAAAAWRGVGRKKRDGNDKRFATLCRWLGYFWVLWSSVRFQTHA